MKHSRPSRSQRRQGALKAGRRPTPLSGLFTAEEWIACSIITEAHEQHPGDYPDAERTETMMDALIYGALRLTELGYTFPGFRFTNSDHGDRPQIDIRTTTPLGGAPGLIGLGPVAMCKIALSFLRRHLPTADADIEMVDGLMQQRADEWGDGWRKVAEGADEALRVMKTEMGLEDRREVVN